nr:unnamed protein product [Callosobruchus chinensis]
MQLFTFAATMAFASAAVSPAKVAVAPANVAVAPSNVVIAAPVLAKVSEDTVDPAPQYSFGYDVQDAITGDNKAHTESRNGDIVQGQYSLNDPDGTRRIVEYTSDPINGFQAVVKKAPLVAVAEPVEPVVAVQPEPVKVIAARTVAAPLVARAITAPLVAKAAPQKVAVAPAQPADVEIIQPAQVETVAPITPALQYFRTPASAQVIDIRSPIQYVSSSPFLAYSNLNTPFTITVV